MTAHVDPPAGIEAARTGEPTADAPRRTFDDHALQIREVLRIVVERRWIILSCGLAGLLIGVLLALMTTPRYRAFALLDYDPAATQSLEQATERQAFRPYMANQEMIATQIGLLRSKSLARRVAEDLNLPALPAYGGRGPLPSRLKRATAIVEASTGAEAVKDSLLIRLSFTSTDPAMAARIANGLAKGFIAANLERRYNSSSYARNFLRDQLDDTKKALEQSERALNGYAISSKLFQSPSQVVDGKPVEGATLSVDDLTALEQALNQARVRRILAESAYRSGAATTQPDNGAAIATLIQERATLQAQYAESAKLFKPDYPSQQALAAQIARLDSEIASERGLARGRQGNQLKAEFDAARDAENKLAAQVAAMKRKVQAERSRSIQYNILQREVDTNRELYDALLQRYKEVGVAGGISQSTISLVDKADTPGAPYRPRLVLNCIVGLVFGLLAGLGIAFAVHLVLDTIVEASDVREKLRLRVLGIVPLKRDGYGLPEALSDRKSEIAEAYYSALTAIRALRAGGDHHVLFITSSRAGEGKSTSAFAIASIFARLGTRVLLIDADLRRPTLGKAQEEIFGFAHLLASGESLDRYVGKTRVDNLSVLPVGRYSGSAAELLSSVRLPLLIDEARRAYDVVVIDGPPVLGLTDAPLLSGVADSTIIVVESGQTRTAGALDMIRRLRDAGGTVLGVVLTKVTRGSAGYGYDYNYYSYESAGGKERFDPEASLYGDEHNG